MPTQSLLTKPLALKWKNYKGKFLLILIKTYLVVIQIYGLTKKNTFMTQWGESYTNIKTLCLLVDLLSHLFSSHNIFINPVIKKNINIVFKLNTWSNWQCLPRPYIMQETPLGRLLHVLHPLDMNTFSLFFSIAHPISFGDCHIFLNVVNVCQLQKILFYIKITKYSGQLTIYSTGDCIPGLLRLNTSPSLSNIL